jgi:uncharacterized protein (TIGR03067 family)
MKYFISHLGLFALTLLNPTWVFGQTNTPAALEPLQGTWKVVRWQDKDIDELPKDLHKDFHEARIIIKNDKMIWTGGKMTLEKTFKVDASKSPKTIDLSWKMRVTTFAEVGDKIGEVGPDKKPQAQRPQAKKPPQPEMETITLPGIYKLEGNRLTIAVIDINESKTRPAEFRVSQDPPTFVIVFERVAK